MTWKAQNQAAVLLAAGQKGHRYTFPHSKISTAPPVVNRVFGQAVDAQLQANELEYATKYYAGGCLYGVTRCWLRGHTEGC